jgi:hypothetical protein
MTDIIDRLNTCLRVYEDSAQGMLKEDLRLAITEIERLRAQVADLTRIAGCVAVGNELADIKREIKEGKNETHSA